MKQTPLTRKTPLRAKPRNITGTQSEAVLRGLQTAKKAKTHKKCPGCKQIVPLTRFGNLAKHTNEEGKNCNGKRKKKEEAPSIQILDSLFSRYVRAKAKNECAFWGLRGVRCSAEMNNMHLKSRRFPSMRWNEDNTVCGCVAHHRHYHDHPDHFYEDVVYLFGEDRWTRVQALWNAGIVPSGDERRALAKKWREFLKECE